MGQQQTGNGTRYQLEVVAVSSGGVGLAWCDGAFSAPPAQLALIQFHVAAGSWVRYQGVDLQAGSDGPLEALAAMLCLNPGRSVVTQAPPAVLRSLHDGYLHPFVPAATP